MELGRSGHGLQKKFVASLLIVGFTPGIVALFATYLYSTHALKNAIGDSFQQLASSTARRIEVMIDDEISEARHLAAAPLAVRDVVEAATRSYGGRDLQRIRAEMLDHSRLWENYRAGKIPAPPDFVNRMTLAYLQSWSAIRPDEYNQIVVTDVRGALVASAGSQTGYLHGDDLWWREAYAEGKGRIYVSDIYEAAPGIYLLDIAVPILDALGQAVGVVKFEVRRDKLMKAIMEIRVGERGHGMLLNTEGTPLICPVLPPKAHLINDPLMHQLMQTKPGWVVAEDDAHGGHNSIVGFAPIRFNHPLSELSLGGHQWYAFVRQDPAETYAPVYTLLKTVGMIGFGMVIVLASLGFYVGRVIVKPILMLQEQADAIRLGVQDLASAARYERVLTGAAEDRRVAIRTGDELESLALAFNQMVQTLEESLKKIRDQEDELLRKEKLASVGQLLAAVAHDIKNPLGVIRGSAQIVLDEHQSDMVKREVAQYVIEEVDRLTNRINHFLRFARQKPPEIQPVAVKGLLDAALREWQALGKGEPITATLQVSPEVPDLMVDPDQVKEALVNLMINAREAMPQGGTLTVSAGSADHGDGPAMVKVLIADTGTGISPEHLKQIFDPFFTTKEYGTGLGLTNVKRLVEDNGGHLGIHSKERAGTEVEVLFPARNR